MTNNKHRDRRGATLVVVMMTIAICAGAISVVLFSTGVRVSRAYDLVRMEQALYLAEAGVERAASWANANMGLGSSGTTITEDWGAAGSFVAVVVQSSGTSESYDVFATGTVNNVNRGVTVRGMQNVSWSRFALWYDKENPSTLYFIPGEVFDGPVYSRPQMYFSASGLGTRDPTSGLIRNQVHFREEVETGASSIYRDSGASPRFDKGIVTSADEQTMTSVDFTQMRNLASNLQSSNKGGLVIDGDVNIELDGNVIRVESTYKEERQKAGKPVISFATTNHNLNLIYANSYPAYTYTYLDRRGRIQRETINERGTVSLSAPNGFDGDMSIVANQDIRIADHVRYAVNPENHADSNDKLGLVANRNVVVQTEGQPAPNNLEIYAHIFCKNGGFGVENYNSGAARGYLKVYGGIANDTRNAVGTFSGSSRTGYIKQYSFDPRFRRDRPAHYPVTRGRLAFDSWEG